ncbi:MAG: hypothetical protein ACFFC7_31175 [Candidatus Hermodarchaeota archaeon]
MDLTNPARSNVCDKNGKKRPALKGSGGENTGIKFLIYSLVFHNLRTIGISRIPYLKPIFIYFDEAASIDENGVNSLLILTEKLNINAIIAMVNPPLIYDSRLTDYIIADNVVSPEISDILTSFEFEEEQ